MGDRHSGNQEKMANDLIYNYVVTFLFRCNGTCFPPPFFFPPELIWELLWELWALLYRGNSYYPGPIEERLLLGRIQKSALTQCFSNVSVQHTHLEDLPKHCWVIPSSLVWVGTRIWPFYQCCCCCSNNSGFQYEVPGITEWIVLENQVYSELHS